MYLVDFFSEWQRDLRDPIGSEPGRQRKWGETSKEVSRGVVQNTFLTQIELQDTKSIQEEKRSFQGGYIYRALDCLGGR